MIPWMSGCRSRATRDLYTQKMASEIRVLEDQLYEADYQNRILRDKLEQERAIKSQPYFHDEPYQGTSPPAQPTPLPDSMLDDLGQPDRLADPGEVTDPGEVIAPKTIDRGNGKTESIPVPVPMEEGAVPTTRSRAILGRVSIR